jgi:large subunit ribosomal protein L31
MKTQIHPELHVVTATCASCGTTFETRSTRPTVTVEVCSASSRAPSGAGSAR